MDKITQSLDIDLYSPTNYDIIHAQQGDNQTRIVQFNLFDKGNIYTVPGNVSMKLEGHRGDGSSFIKGDVLSVRNNNIILTLDSDILNSQGTVEASIVMYDLSNGNILSTIPFRIRVGKNPCDKNNVESNKKSLIDDIIIEIDNQKIDFVNHTNDDIAHLSSDEHERFNALLNEVMSSEQPNDQYNGDYWLRIVN